MGPEGLYYLALAVLVAPSMLINRVAVAIAAAWLVGQFVCLAGLTTDGVDLAVDWIGLLACVLIAAYSREIVHLAAGLVFAPMLAIHAGAMAGQIHPYYAWWLVYVLAFFQIGLMLAGNDWAKARRILSDLREGMQWAF